MAGRYVGWIAGGLFIAGLLICSGYAAIEPTEQAGKVNKKLVAEARETLKAMQAIHDVGRASVEDVYRWSRRVVEADNFSDQAVKDHIAMMRGLHARAIAKAKVAAEGGEEHIVHATEYYLEEAEGFGRQ